MNQSSFLVVDDNEAVRIVTSQMLKRLEVEVHTAVSGADALAQLDDQAFDVVLLDVGMPIMSGIEAYELLRQKLPEQDVIFMTGYSEEELSDLDNRHTWVLPKPFSLDELTNTVREVLSRE